jgi:hypothetical protein
VHLVLQYDHRRFRIPVDAEIVSAGHGHEVVVAAVQVGAVNPALTAMANALRVGEHIQQRLAP